MTWWADVNARARGLASHLLDEPGWTRVRASADAAGLGRELQRCGYPVQPGDEPRTAERAIVRLHHARRALLVRWLGGRMRSLRLYLEADEVRAVRAWIRAAAGESAAGPQAHLEPLAAGIGPGLQAAAAGASSPEAVLVGLAGHGLPLAERALAEHRSLAREWPDLSPLLALEQALVRARLDRAFEGLRRRDGGLRDRLRRRVDTWNVRAVLALGPDRGLPPEAVFLAGGADLDLDDFTAALAEPDPGAARARLAAALPGARGATIADTGVPVSRLDRALLALEVEEERHASLHDPLGPAPILAFLLRQELEQRDLRGLLWARALGAPLDPERWA